MDLKLVIQQMIRQGASEGDIIENLRELGVQDPEKVFAEAINRSPPAQQPARGGLKDVDFSKEQDAEAQGLFDLPPERPVAQKKAAAPAEEGKSSSLFGPPVREAREEAEKPDARMTSVGEGGAEKELSVADLMEKKAEAAPIMRKVAATSADEVEEKLDETIALLKALQEINKRILETDRQVLLRLQK